MVTGNRCFVIILFTVFSNISVARGPAKFGQVVSIKVKLPRDPTNGRPGIGARMEPLVQKHFLVSRA